MSVILIGDVHGFTKTYQKWLRENLDPDQRTIQIGDMGLGFAGVQLEPMSDNHKFFRGNHDDPAKCRAHKNYLGDYGYDESTGIFHVAGAWSIDHAYRIEGISWWADEELSYEELGKAIDLYSRVKSRFVVSHDTPTKTAQRLLYVTGQQIHWSRTSEALQQMLDIHAPDSWYFGHYHVDKEFYTPGYDTKFRCIGGMMDSDEPPHTYELVT